MKTILAAVDFSGITEAVVSTAAQLAQCVGAKVVLLSVVQPPLVATEYAPYVENIGEIEAAADDAATRRLAELKLELVRQSIAVETVQLKGAAVSEIVNGAKAHDAAYIVMGSHGHNAFYDMLVGSTTHGVLLRALCPVVIVPPQAGRQAAARERNQESSALR